MPMSKNQSRPPSVSERRKQEEFRRQQARRRNLIIGGVLLALVAVAVLYSFLSGNDEPATTAGTETTGERPLAAIEPAARANYYDEVPPMTIDTDKTYQAVIRMENGGEMRLNLFDDEAPLTVNNFVFLANQGFYDGTIFHRVLNGFMAQGGDPTGTGAGGPGYEFVDETDNGLVFDRRGLLAMANAGPNTNGSQFFITFVPTPHLDGAHTIFGELVEGDEVLSSLTLRDPATATGPGDVIQEIVIVEQ
jgi:peptidylprolyl isomerase